jgi:hypothetical protein
MREFKEVLKESEIVLGIPILVENYNGWHDKTKSLINNIWENIANYQLIKFASDIQLDLMHKGFQFQTLYLSILKMYMDQFVNYPETTFMTSHKTISEVKSLFLAKDIYLRIPEIDHEDFDIFLYLDSFFIETCSGNNLRLPFILGIKYVENISDEFFFKTKRYGNFVMLEINKNKNGDELDKTLKVINDKVNEHCYIHNEFV